ncbi:saccharopine dehydrogenase NADP-binding domain-containing protein [Amycolatopsis cynarae]|uniref:Saccharopine dehydrogenase NADP-binding domain-containing protein n=1 Tax=Amycolatopsis cynarae TaxID=2995223 RepID=A0ABY7B9I9_9PSEU|nr:saccharopine dehydrogenase C-terminal domain-containing protein [Amycolatopsis sp. HUAS 11-8]WAL68637.1 saccharopine dehydrogenase NADP-binding domain-containing protein [Amycolatopsis sp. HUAS 11-8]
MPEPLPRTVHWVGTGLSTGRGLKVLTGTASRVVLWGRTAARARECLDRVGATGSAEARAFDRETLAREVSPGDVVVSMLPGTEHAGLLRLSLDRGAHFACSSYVSDEIRAGAERAAAAGLSVLTEAGLDPGIDHLFADLLVDKARKALGDTLRATASFTSYCGGVPAEPNEFRYRFSWAPRGVLTALRAPARYVEEGTERLAELPWEVTRSLRLGEEEFEVYPNRDSLPYVSRYGIPAEWHLEEFVRGTLRLDGWLSAWADVFAEVRSGDDDRITALARDLAARYPTTEADRDRVILAVALSVAREDGERWSGEYRLDLTGDPAESAMSRCVSVPLAFGAAEILAGALPPGLNQAAPDAAAASRWLDHLRENGIPISYHDNPHRRRDARGASSREEQRA